MTDRQSTPSAAQLLRKARRISVAGSRLSQGFRMSALFEPNKRRLTLLLTPAQNTRLTVYAPLSLAAQSSVSKPFTPRAAPAPLPAKQIQAPAKKTDPRPLRDKNYQALILTEIHDFCAANRFEIEMNHVISLKTFRQPTQKDFVLLFQFLYGKIDPNHKFTRSIEAEVFPLLKILNYPYLDGINRSSILAVGGQNWPTFLGMLYWLVNLNLTLLNLDEDALIAPDNIFDHIFIKYTFSSYAAFIELRDVNPEHYDGMKQSFDDAMRALDDEAEQKRALQNTLADELDALSRRYGEFEEAQAKSKALENDLKQFSEYMTKMNDRRSQWSTILEQMEAEITNAEAQLTQLEAQKKTLEQDIVLHGFTIQDIDTLNLDRDKLSKSIDTISNKIEDVKDTTARKMTEFYQSFQSLESFVSQYNLMTLKIPGDVPAEFQLALNPKLVEETLEPIGPDEILDRRLRDEKIKLLQRRQNINQEVLRLQEESIRIIEQIEQLSERIFDQQEEIETLEAEITKNKATQDEIYEIMVSEGTSYSAQIEKLDRDLQAMQINANKGIIEAETRNKNLKIQHQETKYSIKERREQLHETVHGLLQYVILFKLNIQENFEELERLALKELEQERNDPKTL